MLLPTSSPPSEEPSEEKSEVEPPTFHPSAPPHEAFDILTTVDPCYIISLIRRLLPLEHGGHSSGIEAAQLKNNGPTTEEKEMLVGDKLENGVALPGSGNNDEVMHSAEASEELLVSAGLMDSSLHPVHKHQNGSVEEASWEEYGCTLWDLAASETHAKLMVENLILDVLLANLMIPHSARVKEICLGIMGNLACHEITRKQISSKDRLTETIIDQLFLDDAPCLCEAFRLIALCIQFGDVTTWTDVLKSEYNLSRILWIAENALNIQLIEKSVGLILAILGSQENMVAVLLPPLMKLGLPSILVNLLDFEIKKLTQEEIYERCCVLEKVLQAFEALSGIDDFSAHICGIEELFKLLIDLVKLPSKSELSSSCISAAVLIASILDDTTDMVAKIAQDMEFLQGILSIFPFTSDEVEAKTALWSIIARVLKSMKESRMNTSDVYRCVSVLMSNYDIIDDAVLDHQVEDDSNEDSNSLTVASTVLSARSIALKHICDILHKWFLLKASGEENACWADKHVNDEDVDKLLKCCSRFI